MEQELQESVDTFKVIFGGENKVDAELFVQTINNTIKLVKASANAIDPTSFLRLEIRAHKEGSFEAVIDVVARCSESLFSKENVRLASEIATGFLAFLQIKQFLRGKKAKKIEKGIRTTKIINQDDNSLEVKNEIAEPYFKNNIIENSIINIFNEVTQHPRDYFLVEHQENKVNITKEDYEHMAHCILTEDSVRTKVETPSPIHVNLLLKKPDLLGHSSWDFVYNKKISARIEDNEFLRKVHQGKIKTLYAGVKIPCLLKIEYELDNMFNLILGSEKYTVLKVTGDIIEPDAPLDIFSVDNSTEESDNQ